MLQLATRMISFGRINEFQAENEAYLERVELFFQANDIADGKKVAVFLSVIGGKTYTLLRNLLSPTKPQEKSFDVLAEELKKHFEPKKVVIAERFSIPPKGSSCWRRDIRLRSRITEGL